MVEPAPTICRKCGGELWQVLDIPHVIADIQPYKSIVTGEAVTSRKAHREHLKRNDLVEVGDQQPSWMPEHREKMAASKSET